MAGANNSSEPAQPPATPDWLDGLPRLGTSCKLPETTAGVQILITADSDLTVGGRFSMRPSCMVPPFGWLGDNRAMGQIDRNALKQFASKYIWWKTPDESVAMPERVIAQVMNIGDHDDIQALARQVGDEVLREVLQHAQAGQFDERSWAYWHYRLGLAELEQVPPLPRRSFP